MGVDHWLALARARLFPSTCTLCGAAGELHRDLCAGCAGDLPYNAPCCSLCAAPLPQEGVCGRCLRHPPPYDAAFALCRYAAPVDRLIVGLKFHGRLGLSRLLGELMAEAIAASGRGLPELLVPVPLHGSRLRRRGFNQALEIARPLGRSLGIPVDYRCCERVRATAAQTGLSAVDRRRNVKGAFRAIKDMEGRSIALVDDVVTTGNTAAELARALRQAGAKRIEVWSCARSVLGDA
jgi:ComF family protein